MIIQKSFLVATLVTTISIFSFASASQAKTVVDIALSSELHTTLVTAVVAADLAETLQSEGPFTVFAPVNDAFANLPAGTLEALLEPENIDVLRSILSYHVIPGKIMAGDLTQGLSAPTVQWSKVSFTHADKAWYINSAKIVATDLVAGNGVVHVIDRVIMPPMTRTEMLNTIYTLRGNIAERIEDKIDGVLMQYAALLETASEERKMAIRAQFMLSIDKHIEKYASQSMFVDILTLLKYELILWNTAANDVVDIAIGSVVHTTLVTAVVEAGLVDTLKSDGPFTLFAPVNTAFAKLPAGTLDSLLAEESKASLSNILTYHVVAGAYMASDITDGLKLTTVQGQDLIFTISNGIVSINGMPSLLMTDIITSNGIVHVIADVLIPADK